MRYLEMQYGPGVVRSAGYAGLEGLGEDETIEAQKQKVVEAQKRLARAKENIKAWVDSIVEFHLPDAIAGLKRAQQDPVRQLEIETPKVRQELEYIAIYMQQTLEAIQELSQGGIIDKSAAEKILDLRTTINNKASSVEEELSALARREWVAQAVDSLERLVFRLYTDTTPIVAALKQAVDDLGLSQPLRDLVDLLRKAGQILAEVPKAAKTLLDYLPWILGGAIALFVLPQVIGVVKAVKGNPAWRPRRTKKPSRYGVSVMGFWPYALAVGAAYLILKPKAPKTPTVTTTIPTIPATGPLAGKQSIGTIPNTLAGPLKQALDAVQIPYMTADRGADTEFFVDSPFASAAKKALEGVKTTQAAGLLTQAQPVFRF